MPLITVEAAGMTPKQKLELIRTLPAEASRIMGVPIDEFRIFLREYSPDNIGVGDIPLAKLFEERGKK